MTPSFQTSNPDNMAEFPADDDEAPGRAYICNHEEPVVITRDVAVPFLPTAGLVIRVQARRRVRELSSSGAAPGRRYVDARGSFAASIRRMAMRISN